MEVRLSNAIEAYIMAKRAEKLSENTLNDYRNTFNKFQRFLGRDFITTKIVENNVIGFLAGVNGVSKKTLRNYHTGLSSLWTYLVETGRARRNIVRAVKAPRPTQRQIEPYTKNEVLALLEVAARGKSKIRDRAMLLLLIDTGVRASELCGLKFKDIDLVKQQISIRNGKGGKSRRIPFSTATKFAVARYIKARQSNSTKNSQPVFMTKYQNPFDRGTLRKIIVRLGNEVRVDDCSVHRFRHTFAIQFLRNGGNIYTLQALLGHSSLDMVKRYLAIAQIDLERDHQKASPVVGWHLS